MKRTVFTLCLLLLLLALALLGPVTPAQGPQEAEEQELETFVPSEKLPADSAVSFPVDI